MSAGSARGGLANKRPELYDRSLFRKVTNARKVFETTFGEDRCIVTWSRDRSARDQKVHDDILEKLRKGRDKGQTQTLDDTKIADAAKNDGFFAIVTELLLFMLTAVKIGSYLCVSIRDW